MQYHVFLALQLWDCNRCPLTKVLKRFPCDNVPKPTMKRKDIESLNYQNIKKNSCTFGISREIVYKWTNSAENDVVETFTLQLLMTLIFYTTGLIFHVLCMCGLDIYPTLNKFTLTQQILPVRNAYGLIQPIPLGVTFSNDVSKLKAQSSNFFFH